MPPRVRQGSPPSSTSSASPTRRRRRLNPLQAFVQSTVWSVLRVGITAIGLSAIAGTILAVWGNFEVGNTKQQAEIASTPAPTASPVPGNLLTSLQRSTPNDLRAKLEALIATEADLGAHLYVLDLDSGQYVNLNGDKPVAAASTIKIPLLIAFLQDVDAGKIRLDEQLTVDEEVIVGEAGELQGVPPGTKISALETITLMIEISDNTATNMVIRRLGGIAAVNQRFQSWGLTATAVRNPLPDLEGSNTISTKELATVLAMVSEGQLLKPRSRDLALHILERTVTDTLLPRGLGEGARIAHKTGDIGSSVGDAGRIDMPNGKRYFMAMMVKRPHNDRRANNLIAESSKVVYDYFASTSGPTTPPSVPPAAAEMPSPTDTPAATPEASPTPAEAPN